MTETDVCLGYFHILLLVVTFGGFGGVVSAYFDNFNHEDGQTIKSHPCNKCNSSYFGRRAFIGITGAFCAMFFALWVEKITLKANTNNLMLLSSFCVVAGLISFRVLPTAVKKIEERLFEKEINDLKNKIDEKSDASIEYTRVMLQAETALGTKSIGDVNNSIVNLKEIRGKYSRDRTLHIYLGRLYRIKEEYDASIDILNDFISTINKSAVKTVHDDIDQATAYYNIACYLALKAKKVKDNPPEYDKLTTEALSSYKKAVSLSEKYESYAKTDSDISWLIECA